MLKILSWNIQQGGGSRTHAIALKLIAYNPMVIVLSEFRNNPNGLALRKKLMDYNYFHQYVTAAPSDKNSVLIASKYPANSILYNDNKDLAFPNNVIAVDLGSFHLFGLYMPHKKKHKLFELLLEEIKTKQPAIVVGDYNTGINHVDQVKDSFWYQAQMKKFQEAGMEDAFRHLHGKVKEYSWYSHQKNGYRYDHSYVSKDLLPVVKSCFYLHEWREDKLSDHSPMVLELA